MPQSDSSPLIQAPDGQRVSSGAQLVFTAHSLIEDLQLPSEHLILNSSGQNTWVGQFTLKSEHEPSGH